MDSNPVNFWKTKILAGGLILVLMATLLPYQPDLRGNLSVAGKIIENFDTNLYSHDFVTDFPRNVLLFIPLGFGLAAYRDPHQKFRLAWLIKILSIGLGLSFLAELIQVWYPSRVSSLLDLVANSVGVIAGVFLFHFFGPTVLSALSSLLQKINEFPLAVLLISLILFLSIISVIMIIIQQSLKLEDWNETFSLVLGNEATGDRPWRGSIYEVHFTDQAIPENQVAEIFATGDTRVVMENDLIASYILSDNGSLDDWTGHMPELVWTRNSPGGTSSHKIKIDKNNWMATKRPVTALSQALMETSQFSLITSLAAESTEDGAGRIITISGDPNRRNFTIQQTGKDLIVRFRTAATGENAMRPVIVVPNVFIDDQQHTIIVTYDSTTLRIYVDDLEQSYSAALTPEVMMLHWLLGTWYWYLSIDNHKMFGFILFFYALVFIPTGLLLAQISFLAKQWIKQPIFLVLAGILIATTFIEAILARERSFNSQHFAIGLIIITITSFSKMWALSSRTITVRGGSEL